MYLLKLLNVFIAQFYNLCAKIYLFLHICKLFVHFFMIYVKKVSILVI
jgi:hypothetical protein